LKLAMKKIVALFFPILIIVIASCSDTIVTHNTSNELEKLSAPPVIGLFKKNVLIEDYTGTWCGFCVSVVHSIDEILSQSNNQVVAVAIHNGSGTTALSFDPFHFAGIDPLKPLISNSSSLGLPIAKLNRTTTWQGPDYSIIDAKNLKSNNCGLGLANSSTLTANSITLNVKLKLAQNYSNLRLVVYILENHLFYKQTNYTTYYGNVNPILNFDHNHVLRTSLTSVLGDAITENTNYGQTVTKTFNFTVPSNIANANNISFVAFVIDANNTVINVRGAQINENQDFEENL
jgi:thiol-disulfide isomerase/thioredoxin